METDLTAQLSPLVLSLPAVIALVFKVILLVYAGYSQVKNQQTRLFLYLLFALALHNVTEIFLFYEGQSGVPIISAFSYFVVAIIALALFIHFALSLATNFDRSRYRTHFLVVLYGYALLLEVLLLSTPLLVNGFAPLEYSYYRVPGPQGNCVYFRHWPI